MSKSTATTTVPKKDSAPKAPKVEKAKVEKPKVEKAKVDKSSAKPAASKGHKKVEDVAAVAAAAAADPVVTEAVESTVAVTADVRMTELITRYGKWMAEGVTIRNEMRALEKILHKTQKAYNKKAECKKSRKSGEAKRLSGFAAPTKISDELAAFLGREPGTEMARTEVTSEITAYIKEHGLQNPSNGRQINPDAKLQALLKSSPEDDVTYFNLQKFMKGHYVSKKAPVA